ncbi:MAG: NADH-quinone oxidoreductase subunit NuoE [Phycisphaerae bacterium]|jgi:NADH:ubiquinone oxidoreductase subunit E
MIKTEDQKQTELNEFITAAKQKPRSDSHLIAVMHKAQELYGYLPLVVIDDIAVRMEVPRARVWGVATFYHYFNLKPQGKYTISVCLGTACYVKGASDVLKAIKDKLGIEMGETTEDGLFSLAPARCLGACGLAPVVMIGDKIHGELTPKKVTQLIDQYRKKAVQ